MIGLSRATMTAGVNSLAVRIRGPIASEIVVNTFLWPVGKTRVHLQGDLSSAHLADPARSFRLALWVFLGGVWREWCGTTYTGSPPAPTIEGYPVAVQPILSVSSLPPVGTPCEMRVAPVTGALETGVTVRGT